MGLSVNGDKKRLHWIDVARGIAMLCIVMGHAVRAGSLYSYLITFSVPLFIVISGYLFNPEKASLIYLRKQAQRLYIPYLIVGLVSVLIYCIFGQIAVSVLGKKDANTDLLHNLFGLVYGNGSGNLLDFNLPLWFLPCFFSLTVIEAAVANIALTSRLSFQKASLIISIILSSVSYAFCNSPLRAPLPLGIETAFALTPFFSLGVILRSKFYKLENLLASPRKSMLLLTILFGSSLLINAVNALNCVVDYPTCSFGDPILFYGQAIMQAVAYLVIAFHISRNEWLEQIGKSTIGILVIHKFPLLALQFICSFLRAVFGISIDSQGIAFAFFAAIVAIGISMYSYSKVERCIKNRVCLL